MRQTSAVIYSGKSQLDKVTPIIAIALAASRNRKTGPMVQTYIIRPDIDPLEASRTGADKVICGDCQHRGTARASKPDGTAVDRSCYVNLGHGPLQVYKAYKRGVYADYSRLLGHLVSSIGSGKTVRLGTYGDPAAVPCHVWEQLTHYSTGSTGYTHNAHYLPKVEQRRLQKLCMYSADSEEQATQARADGWRTFRVSHGVKRTVGETLCPASAESGHRTTCSNCLLCSGSESAGSSVYIPAHGNGKIHFLKSIQ